MVGMTEKTQHRAGIEQAFEGLAGSEDIFVFVLIRAVDQHHSFRGFWSSRKSGEPRHELGRQLRLCPVHGHFGNRVKIVRGHDAGDRFVMVTANRFFGDAL